MNEQDKSIALAKLMGWDVHIYDTQIHFKGVGIDGVLQPYDEREYGRAQFATLLLTFPDVLLVFQLAKEGGVGEWEYLLKPTQENILDEILRMNGVDT